jgi:multidrug resistance protein, MATE family
MTFAVHTEKLNLISIVAAEYHDEVHDAKVLQRQQQQQAAAGSNDSMKKNSAITNGTNDDDDVSDAVNPYKNVRSYESRMYEMISLFQLAIPTFIIQLGSIIPGFAIASYVGRKYSNDIVYLDGYTLASLTANLFTLSLLQGLYTASDTLSPQAYGAGNMKEVGYLAVRGFIASMMVVLPITILLIFYMKPLLLWIGEDSESVTHACAWFNIYAFAIPFYALYQVTTKFLSAQNQMQPLVVCCLLSTCVVLPISLYTLGKLYGYIGTAIAIVIYQIFQSISLILYIWIIQPHDTSTWPGLYDGIRNAIMLKPFLSYMVR